MKKLIQLLSTVLILIFSGTLSAQYVPLSLDYKSENSQLIVEGKVTATKSFIANDNKIYTENIIEVSKVHKGDFREEKFAVITMGGTVGERTTVWSHLLNLNSNEYGVFFLIPSKRPKPDETQFSSFDVFGGSQGFYHFQRKDNGVHRAFAVLDNHNSVSEFYQAIGARDFDESPFVSPFDLVNEDDCLSFKIEPVTGSSFNIPASSSFTSNTQIWFNVMVKINEGYYKLNKSELLLKYSTEWFYENMADEGYITFVQGEFDEASYNFQLEDHEADVVKLKTEATTTDYNALEAVEGQWKLLVSIGVTIKNISDEDPLQQLLDNSNIIENNYRTIQGYLEDFECVKLEYGANCGMEITSITPTAAAGVGEMSENGTTGVVEIIGDNFLDDDPVIGNCIKPDDHHVKFRTIDNNWIAPLEGDYLEYTNTTIRVKVPTVGYKNNSDDLYSGNEINDGVACTGEVRVCRKGFLGINCGCFVTSDTDIYVPFAASNTHKTNDDGCRESIKYVLQDLDDAGGYTWRFGTAFKAVAGAVDAFKRALTTWRCATRVNFKVDEVNPPAAGTGLCKVTMTNLPVGTRASTNFTVFGTCGGTDIKYPVEIELSFNSTMDWHTGTDMPPDLNWNNTGAGTLEGDMESTGLHELGHAHLLLHTCNTPNVMVRPGPNDYRRGLTSNDEDGGNHLSMLGNSTHGCQGEMELIDLAGCDITPVIEIGGKAITVSIFPNPSHDMVSLEFSSEISGDGGNIDLIDTFGKRLISKGLRANETSLRIDLSQYPSGIYYLQFWNNKNEKVLIGKISKIK